MTTLAPAVAAGFDDRGVTLDGAAPSPLLLHVDGQYVWSFDPRRDGTDSAGTGTLVPWPRVLLPYLDGTATLTLLTTAQEVVVEQEVRLGSGHGRISVTDRQGRPLAVDKVGHLGRVFDETDQAVRAEVVDATARLLRDLREHCEVEAYLNYGCLLGAVRNGRMVGHDFDSDLCYLSRHTTPADVITESFRVQRVLRGLGWRTIRMSAGDVKAVVPLSDGQVCHIDVFVAFYVDGVFYQLGNRSGHLPREAVVPLSTVRLEGVELPAPADPEAMLAFLYGPSWRVPDPSFKYADPPAGVRRLNGWLRGFRSDAPQWSAFFESPEGRSVPGKRSTLAAWTHGQIEGEETIVDLGCGNGRDSAYFLRRGHPVLALDFSVWARRLANQRLRKVDPDARSEAFMLGDLRRVLSLGAELARSDRVAHLYARRLLGCLDDAERANLWVLARTALRGRGSLVLEFAATVPGQELPTALLERRLDPEAVVAEVRASGGDVVHLRTGPGTDLLDQPDPAVCRLRAVWPRHPRRILPSPEPQEIPMNTVQRVRGRVRRSVHASQEHRRSVAARLAALEAEVQENRQLNRRIAELTDVVVELLVPLQDRDEEQVRATLAAYRAEL